MAEDGRRRADGGGRMAEDGRRRTDGGRRIGRKKAQEAQESDGGRLLVISYWLWVIGMGGTRV